MPFGQKVKTQMKCRISGISSGSALFAKLKQSSGTEVHLNLEILTGDPLIYTMNHPKFNVSRQMEEFISIQREN